ncbi:MAG: formylglycine-generating enzyme family protein, partial [bacterium]|nr:formylglycine-generating enzyme family protein [bacterium]
EPRLVVYLESIAGPFLNVKPYLELDGYFQLNPRRYDWALYAGITADLGIVVRGWDDDWGELPSWNLLDYKTDPPLASGKYPPGWQSPEEVVNSIGMKFRRIQPGSFMMGSEKGWDDETPVHKVTLTRGFYMGVYEVTQEEWEKVMGSNPSEFKGPKNPVETVSWHDAQEFARRLSQKENVTYRLPTEAEWEYACRAGTTTEFYWGDDPDCREMGDYAWYYYNSGETTHPVGQKKPNARGLYDMSGNVWEWCQDWYADKYSSASQTDPTGPAGGSGRVDRGGGWRSYAFGCRSAWRGWNSPSDRGDGLGFRLVRAIP